MRVTPMTWQKRVLLSALPIGVLLTAAGLATYFLPPRTLLSLYGLVLLILPAGKLVALAPVVEGTVPFSPVFIASLVALIDSCIALFIAINLPVLYQLPWVGNGLRSMEAKGHLTLSRHLWIRRMAMLGVAVFVALPIPGTGAIGGTIVARLVGFSPTRSFLMVFLGTVIGAYGIALGAHTLLIIFPPQPSSLWLGLMRLGIIVLLIVLLSWLGQRGTARRKS